MIKRYIALMKHKRKTRKELHSMTDEQLYDIGVLRYNINRVVKGIT